MCACPEKLQVVLKFVGETAVQYGIQNLDMDIMTEVFDLFTEPLFYSSWAEIIEKQKSKKWNKRASSGIRVLSAFYIGANK